METNNFTNFTKKYKCDICNISCSRNIEWDRHLNTAKHQKKLNGKVTENNFTTNKEYKCECNKKFKSHSGLWKHKKKCKYAINNEIDIEKEDKIDILINENKDFKNIILELVKTNGDLQKQMIEVCKNSNNSNNTNHSYNNNKTFNMQIFLNEKCKDAMNIMDFVNSMTLELSDLEDVGELGYVDGISNIIIKKLNEMDIHKRPVHCSDTKRETLFVKDNNVWEKEESGRDTLRRAIKYISKKNSDLLPAWSEENPESQNIHSKRNDHYIKMVLQAMGGRGDIETNENKIIKKISKSVIINKNEY